MSIQRLNMVLSLAVVASLAVISTAHAATVGAVLNNTSTSFTNFPIALSALAYISGLFLAVAGIFKFKDHVDSPSQTPLSAGVKRFLAGGMMLALPFMSSAVKGNLMGGGGTDITATARHGAPTGTAMDAMIYNFIIDFAHPMEFLLSVFCYIMAIALLLVGISRLTKGMQEGPRGPAGMGTLMTFIAAGALFSIASMMGTFLQSLFGSTNISSYATISTTVLDAASAAKVEPVVEAVMIFVMLVGMIAFIRGWFVLKSFADGNQGVSLAQGLTFLFGGALAINLGQLVNVLQTTVGATGITFS
jgi:intracellular multiplication protein IcmC